ncbi:MAG TPA: sulfotransferase [Conexibacter sp.]|nr:sulfotransferase [Conexibacter sp.]
MDSIDEVTPIFLLSTARSGSTLLQRILGSYPEIATAAEPWLLIPLVYALRGRGVHAEYEHGTLAAALEDFSAHLPGGQADFDAEVRDFAERLYARSVGPGQRYFLDKTPPYFLIVDELLRIFPDAKFVFLWRNPLAIAASLADWPQRNWGGLYRENLFYGLANLINARRANVHCSHAIRFEDYVSGDVEAWRGLMDYLELPFRSESLSEFTDVELTGRMGDKHGSALYGALSAEPLEKWRTTLANPLRKEAARRYLSWLGAERLAVMGYDGHALSAELEALPVGMDNVAADVRHFARALIREPFHARLRSMTNVGRPSSLRYILGAGRHV